MSKFDSARFRFTETVLPGSSWSHVMKRGTTLRMIDLEGGVNVSMLMYNFELPVERLNLPDTLKCQHTARLTKGHCLYSDMGRILACITADTCGWHDPLAGCSNSRSVSQKYGELNYQTARNDRHQNGYDNFLRELGKYGLSERDLTMNINFFQKVSANESGRLIYHEDHSQSGSFVELNFRMNTLVILNTCLHPLDSSTHYSPKTVRLEIGDSTESESDFCRDFCLENQRGFTLTERYFL